MDHRSGSYAAAMAEPEVAPAGLRFGTDGVRARAGTRLDEPSARALGLAAAPLLGTDRVVIGRDTRESGPGLSLALAEGLSEGGLQVVSLGVAPTPAVAHVAAADGVAGAVVSASHNPWYDNGVKLFSAGGRKLDDVVQSAVQAAWDAEPRRDGGGGSSSWSDDPDGAAPWADAVASSVGNGSLSGLTLVVDCANGATSAFAADVLTRLGADVAVLHACPNGRNINEGCGSNHPGDLRAAVVEAGADAGLAFDGDGDRVLAVAGDGSLLDGDDLLAICAIDRYQRGALPGGTVVVTVMANLGLRRTLVDHGLTVHETAVGDRYVLEALEANGWVLGGEQSGHVVFRDLATTGDGLLTGIQALDAARRSGQTMGERATELMVRVPQVLHAVPVSSDGAAVVAAVADDLALAEAELGDTGRVLVRPSGTEPVVRVMVEAYDTAEASEVADRLVAAVEQADRF